MLQHNNIAIMQLMHRPSVVWPICAPHFLLGLTSCMRNLWFLPVCLSLRGSLNSMAWPILQFGSLPQGEQSPTAVSACQLAPACVQVKMLCSSGGHFNKLTTGGWEYTGGETRLVSVSSDCHMQELQDALHRVSQTMRLDLSSSRTSVWTTSALQQFTHAFHPACHHVHASINRQIAFAEMVAKQAKWCFAAHSASSNNACLFTVDNAPLFDCSQIGFAVMGHTPLYCC